MLKKICLPAIAFFLFSCGEEQASSQTNDAKQKEIQQLIEKGVKAENLETEVTSLSKKLIRAI